MYLIVIVRICNNEHDSERHTQNLALFIANGNGCKGSSFDFLKLLLKLQTPHTVCG